MKKKKTATATTECPFLHIWLIIWTFSFSSLLTIESQCLARYHDNVWYPAIVESIEEDHKYMVRFQSYGTSETVGLDSIIPAGRWSRLVGENDWYLTDVLTLL